MLPLANRPAPPRSHRRTLRRLAAAVAPALVAVALLTPASARAAEYTRLAGSVQGVEICPQIFCGAAVFLGRFDGTLEGAPGTGQWWVAVRHEELPAPGAVAPITGGSWGITVEDRALRGVVTSGTIRNNGDDTFTVTPLLDLRTGGQGALALTLLLDHAPFPPAVEGAVLPGLTPPPIPGR